MLDESITSSPSKSNKSIHKVRLLRKNKRKKLDENIQNRDIRNETNVDKILLDFYKGSEDELDDALNKDKNNTFTISKPSAIIENYKPFEMEQCLAMADRLTTNQQDDRNKDEFPENQGFYTCQTMEEKEMSATAALTEQESSFLITESELINCCHQAEKVFEEKKPALQKHEIELANILEPGSPNRKMSLVNSILEDFSQSPLSKDQSVTYTYWQHTPEFRLRRKPIKTYSRKCLNRTRTNLSKRLESISSDDDRNSNCSSISVQEEVAPLGGVYSGTGTDTSQRLCQNLLNLSAFFTQSSSTNSSQDLNYLNCSDTLLTAGSQERLLYNISSIIYEILKLRSTCPDKLTTDSYSSNQDFCGFPSQKEEDTNSIDLVVEYEHVHLNKTLIEHILPLEEQKMDIISSDVNNMEFNNWIEDSCEGVFSGINTDELLLQNIKSTNDPPSHKLTSNVENVVELVKPKSPENVERDERLNQAQNSTKFAGFKTASSKTIKVSRNAHIVAAKILSKLPDIPYKSKVNNYDNRVVKKDSTTTKEVDIFENPDDCEWNDDSDIFINFKTPAVLNEKQNIEEDIKEKFSYKNDYPSTSKMAMKANIGFQAAAGQNLAISQKAQESVQRIFKEFATDINEYKDCDELNEIKMKICTKTHNEKTQKTNLLNIEKNADDQFKANEILEKIFESNTNSIKGHDKESSKHILDILDIKDTNVKNPQYGNMGFQTAQGKKIKISTKAQQSVEKLLKEFVKDCNENFESDLAEMKDKINQKNAKRISYVNNCHDTSNQITEYNEILNNNIEFQKVYGEQIKVATDSQRKINQHEKSRDYDVERQNQNSSKILLNKNIGKKNLISTVAHQGVEFNTDFKDNIVENLQTMKNDINSKYYGLEPKPKSKEISESNEELGNIMLSEWPLSNHSDHKKDDTKSTELLTTKENEERAINDYNSRTLKNCDIANKQISLNIGFQTAKGKKIPISAKAQQAVDKLLQEFRSDLNETYNEQNLMDMKSKIEMKNKQLKQINNNFDLKSTQETTEYSNMIFSEWPLTQTATPNKQLKRKRKLSIDNSDIPSPITARSPPSKIINKGLYATKSSFNEFTINSPLKSSPATSISRKNLLCPLNPSPANSLISRKNLLSLTKRRKNKRNAETNQDPLSNINDKEIPKIYKELVATPIKSSIRPSIQTPATPNLKEFFSNAPQTSTPREEKKSLKSPHKVMDGDFKPINWDNNNDSGINSSKLANANRTTNLSDSTCSNISLNSSKPTAKERIARLKMYGKPPPVSPILIETHNSCRPSGLRRTRSMLKKTEN